MTLLFTDIEGSTRLLERLGDDYRDVLEAHRQLLRAAFAAHGGVEVDTQGDSFFVAFAHAGEAVGAAVDAQRALLGHEWPQGEAVRVRMGIHTGEPVRVDDRYVGIDVHRAARIAAAAHGGQVVISASTRALIAGDRRLAVILVDKGMHRLKGLDRAERIVQVHATGLPWEFPPLKTLETPTNIPLFASQLIGRHAEIDALGSLLQGEGVRLVTITGVGGTGKTRLAAAVAWQRRDEFAGGVFFVDLTQARTKDTVALEIAQPLGLSFDEADDPLALLVDGIGERQMLLVMDNFEQALEAATLVSDLLQSCPRLKVVATSRVPLSLRAEREFPLAPLSLPAGTRPEQVASSDAGRLFVERASQVRPGFELIEANAPAVAAICDLLDGLPLAIELAAARVRLFPPQWLLERLDDRLGLLTGGPRDAQSRHQAMRTTIDWSYDLLSPEDRDLFRDFAVFTGGASLEAVEHVMADTVEDVLDRLTTLVQHNLIQPREGDEGDVRFRMLQTIRDYALERLADSSKGAALRERHAGYYLAFVEHANVEGDQRTAALSTVDRDHDNVQTALSWWLERAGTDPEAATNGLRLAVALGRYWYTHGRTLEGTTSLERALASASEASDVDRADALRWLGILLEQQKRYDPAWDALQGALALYRKSGNRAGEAACLNSLGIAARNQQDDDEAEALLSESVAIRRAIGDTTGTAAGLGNLAIIAVDRGRLDDAQRLLEESLSLSRADGDEWGVAAALNSLGAVQVERGEGHAAGRMLADALRTFSDLGDLDGVVETMEVLAGAAAAAGDAVRATRLAGASEAIRRRIGIPLSDADLEIVQRWMEPPLRELGDQRFHTLWDEGAQMTTEQAVDYSLEESPP